MKRSYVILTTVAAGLAVTTFVGAAFGLGEAASSLPKRAYLVQVANDEPRSATPAATPTESSQTAGSPSATGTPFR